MRDKTVLPGLEAPRKPAGGYALVPVVQLAMAWWCYQVGLIKFIDLRTWLACHELQARRCRLKRGEPAKFVLAELRSLTGGTEKRLHAAIGRLQAVGLLTWSESAISFGSSPEALTVPDPSGFVAFFEQLPNRQRRVPVPRRMIRMLAGGTTRAVLATVLAHLLRCVYFRNGGCEARGTCKASWIARVFGISLRAAKAARKHLIDLRWLLPSPTPQWRMNRYGLTMTVNLGWSVNPAWARLDGVPSGAPAGERAGEGGGPISAPPGPAPGPVPAPPESDRELPPGSKNQEPAPGGGPAGFLSSGGEPDKTPGMAPNREPTPPPASGPPRLADVRPEDLRDTGRTLELFRQATLEGVTSVSEADRLRFVAAAEHARVIGTRNPCGLFVRIVRSKLWSYLTQDDEDAASARLKRHLFGGPLPASGPPNPERLPTGQGLASGRGPELSADARIVRAVRAEAVRAGYRGDVFYLLRRHSAEWTRERFDRATAELANPAAPGKVSSGGLKTLADGILGRVSSSLEG